MFMTNTLVSSNVIRVLTRRFRRLRVRYNVNETQIRIRAGESNVSTTTCKKNRNTRCTQTFDISMRCRGANKANCILTVRRQYRSLSQRRTSTVEMITGGDYCRNVYVRFSFRRKIQKSRARWKKLPSA